MIELALLLLFYTSTMRYLTDLNPSLVLLSALGFWQLYTRVNRYPILGKLLVVSVFLLTIFTISAGFLLAITGYQARFETLNPILFDQITRFLTP